MAQVKVTFASLNDLAAMRRPIRERIGKLLQRLQAWPNVSGAKPLSGDLAGRYRLRTGDYRLRFRVEGETVIVAKIGHRSEFNED